jgi:hypothetical protein
MGTAMMCDGDSASIGTSGGEPIGTGWTTEGARASTGSVGDQH